MSFILNNLSDESLAGSNLKNLYASTTFSYNLPGAEKHSGEDISWCITDIPVRACNVVFNARLKPDNANGVIESIIAKAREKGVPLRWYVDNNSEPGNLGESLVSQGFRKDKPVPMMAVDLQALKEDIRGPSGLEIVEIKDIDVLKTWENTCARGFGGNPQGRTPIFRWLSFILEAGLPMRFFLAVQNGVPVATSELILAEGVAGIDRVATVPEARNRGFGYAVTLHPLRLALKEGYRIGVLQASEAGEPVYHRMGFRKCGEVTNYHWDYSPGA